jgi:hypothetical protein
MIPEWMAIALLSLPCNSDVVPASNSTIVYQCAKPQLQGPPRPPIWWRAGMFDKAEPTKIEKPKAKKKKRSKKKRRR